MALSPSNANADQTTGPCVHPPAQAWLTLQQTPYGQLSYQFGLRLKIPPCQTQMMAGPSSLRGRGPAVWQSSAPTLSPKMWPTSPGWVTKLATQCTGLRLSQHLPSGDDLQPDGWDHHDMQREAASPRTRIDKQAVANLKMQSVVNFRKTRVGDSVWDFEDKYPHLSLSGTSLPPVATPVLQ